MYLNRKKENFDRLSKSRVDKIKEQLRLIRNLSNTANYSYTIEQAKDIVEELRKDLDLTEYTLEQRLIDRQNKSKLRKERNGEWYD